MKRTLFVLSLSLLLSSAAVKADIISVTGQATLVSPPASVDLTHTGAIALVFDEESVVLSSPVAVDISAPGTYASLASLTGGTISAGTAVSSFYYHSFGPDISGDEFEGSITFSTPILGVEALAASLVATNGVLGSPATTYSTSDVLQSFEFGSQIDSVTISPDRLTLSFLNETFNAPDDLRIITAQPEITATPEPSSLLLLGVGLMALIALARLSSTATRRG
jgi:hypothetical protein